MCTGQQLSQGGGEGLSQRGSDCQQQVPIATREDEELLFLVVLLIDNSTQLRNGS